MPLKDDLEKRLNELVQATGRKREYYQDLAMAEFLDRRADYLTTLARLESEKENISWEDVKQALKGSS